MRVCGRRRLGSLSEDVRAPDRVDDVRTYRYGGIAAVLVALAAAVLLVRGLISTPPRYGFSADRAPCVLGEAGVRGVHRVRGFPGVVEGAGAGGSRVGIAIPTWAASTAVLPLSRSHAISLTVDGDVVLYVQARRGVTMQGAWSRLQPEYEAVRDPEIRQAPAEGQELPRDSACVQEGGPTPGELPATGPAPYGDLPPGTRVRAIQRRGATRWARATDGCCVGIAVPRETAAAPNASAARALASAIRGSRDRDQAWSALARLLAEAPAEWRRRGVLESGLIRLLGARGRSIVVAVPTSARRASGRPRFDEKQGWITAPTSEDPNAVASSVDALLRAPS